MFTADRSEFVDPKEQTFISRSLNGDDTVPGLGKSAGDGIDRSGTHSAGHHDHGPVIFNFTGISQGTEHCVEGISWSEFDQLSRRSTDRHDHHGDCSRFDIVVGNGKRNAFTMIIGHDDEKLSRPRPACEYPVLNDHLVNIRSKFPV